VPKTGRLLIGMVAGFKSERWPVFDRNGGRLHLGIRTFAGQCAPAGLQAPVSSGFRNASSMTANAREFWRLLG
jgi:hypothetical protein